MKIRQISVISVQVLASEGKAIANKKYEQQKIRSVWNDADQKMYFVVEDVVAALTDSNDSKQYVKRMKQRDSELAKGWVQTVPTHRTA